MIFGWARAAAEPLEFISGEIEPYYGTCSNGDATGLVVESLKRIFAEAGYSPNFRCLPLKRLITESTGDHAIVTIATKTNEWALDWLFSEAKLFEAKVSLFRLKDTEAIGSVTQLNGKRVIVVLGSEALRQMITLNASTAKIIDARDQETALLMLKNHRADYLVNYEALTIFVTNKAAFSDFEIMPLQSNPIYLMTRRSNPFAKETMRRINEAMTRLREKGELP
jgi:polar amino acid transport system substrate-binding protein